MKLKDEQLKQLQELVGKINNAKAELGHIEMQKHEFLHQSVQIQTELTEFQKSLEEEYGQVSINISTGEITEAKEEQSAN